MKNRKRILPVILIILGVVAFGMMMTNRAVLNTYKKYESRAVHIISERTPRPSPAPVMTPEREKTILSELLGFSKEIISILTSLCGLLLLVKQLKTGKNS